MRKAAWAAAAAVLVLVLSAALLPRLVSLDSLRPRIAAALEEKTGRRVTLSGIRLMLFPGIGVRVTGLSVSGDPGRPGEQLLSVPEAEIRAAILPLLNGRAELTTFVLRRPSILFRKYADGTHSATEIANRLAAREREAPPRAAGEEKVSVRLRTVRIEDAALSLRVEEPGGKETRWDVAPLSFSLSGIGGMRHDFSLSTRLGGALRGEIALNGSAVRESGAVVDPSMFDLKAAGELFGQKVTAEGKMSAPAGAPAEIDLAVALPDVRMDAIPKIFAEPPAWLAALRPEGRGAVKARVSGDLLSMGFEVEADLTRAGWAVAPGLRKFIDAPCTVVVEGHRFADMLAVSNAEVRFPPLLLIANAAYTPSTGAREWKASARISSLREFARSRGEAFSRYFPKGRVTASGHGRKPSASAPEEWEVAVDLGEAGVHLEERRIDLRELNGHVELSPARAAFLPLAGLFNGQRFTLRGSVALGGGPRGDLELRMAYLDVDALFPPDAGKGAGEDGKKTRTSAPARGGGDARPVAVRAKVRIDAGKVRGLEFSDLAGTVTYEKGVLLLDSVRARIFGGDATLSGRIGLAALSRDFHVTAAARNVSAADLLGRNTSLKDYLFGKASFSGEISGSAADFAAFSRTAAGSGALRITGGKIRGVDLFGAAASLSGLSALLPGGAPVAGRAPAGETAFSDLSADFRVQGGKIRADVLRLSSERLGLSGSALIGFDRTIDFRGTVLLSKDLSRKASDRTGSFLRGPGGQVEIPIVLSGPLTAPAVALDSEALAAGLAGKMLRGLVPPREPAGSGEREGASGEPARPAPRKAVEGLFEKLLPRR